MALGTIGRGENIQRLAPDPVCAPPDSLLALALALHQYSWTVPVDLGAAPEDVCTAPNKVCTKLEGLCTSPMGLCTAAIEFCTKQSQSTNTPECCYSKLCISGATWSKGRLVLYGGETFGELVISVHCQGCSSLGWSGTRWPAARTAGLYHLITTHPQWCWCPDLFAPAHLHQ